MARIPKAELERLKREVAVERLAQARGVELKPHGGNLIGLCPFHDDHEPSFVVTPAKNLWHCLGACQAGGSVIDFVMKAEGVSFRPAVELLRGELGGALPQSPAGADLSAAVTPDADDRALLRGDRVLPRSVSQRHGCQCLRAQGDACSEEPRCLAPPRVLARQRDGTAGERADHCRATSG